LSKTQRVKFPIILVVKAALKIFLTSSTEEAFAISFFSFGVRLVILSRKLSLIFSNSLSARLIVFSTVSSGEISSTKSICSWLLFFV